MQQLVINKNSNRLIKHIKFSAKPPQKNNMIKHVITLSLIQIISLIINHIISLKIPIKIIQMDNITIINHFIKTINILPNKINIEAIHALMDGKIKDTDKIL